MVASEGVEPSYLAALVSKTSVYAFPPRGYGRPSEIRTQTLHILNVLPLPVGLKAVGSHKGIRTLIWTVFETVVSADCTIWL